MPPTAPTRPPASRALVLFAWVVGTALAGWFLAWVPASHRTSWLSPQPLDYYHELTDAILSGHLHLAREPDPRLVALPDPYDPQANAPYRVNDLSYSAGRYYLYHSAAPVLLLMVPVKVVTGLYLSSAAATGLFCLVGAAASVLLLLRFRRDHAPDCPRLIVAAAVLALLTLQGGHAVLRNDLINLVPIAMAYACLMLGLLAVQSFLRAGRIQTRHLGLAGLALGLAVAARPNYLFAATAILGLTFWSARRRNLTLSPRLVLTTVAPFAAILATVLAHNFARFGNPLEFGGRLMLGAWDQRTLANADLSSVAANVRQYLYAPGLYSSEFPFVTSPNWEAIGILGMVPFLWLIPLVLFPGLRRSSSALRPLPSDSDRPQSTAHRLPHSAPGSRPILWAAAVAGTINLIVLILLPSGNTAAAPSSANGRYLVDFLPALVLLAALGAVAAGHAASGRRGLRRGLTTAVVGLTAISLLIALSLDLGRFPAESVRPLARFLSRPAWQWQRLTGAAYGPIALDLVLPAGKTGKLEPLLATGDWEASDMIYVVYESPTTIRLGLIGDGIRGPLSAPLPVDYAASHHVELHLGSLNPSVAHPDLARFSDAAVAGLKRRVAVVFDGQLVLDGPAHFYPASPAQVFVGRNLFLLGQAETEFSGQLTIVTRLPLQAPPTAIPVQENFGALRFTMQPKPGPEGTSEPLLTTGIPRAGDVVFLTHGAGGRFRVGLDHWGTGSTLSDWIEGAPGAGHTVEIHSGALLPPPGHPWAKGLTLESRDRVRVLVDGRPVLEGNRPAFPSSPFDVVVGFNPIGASSTGYAFSGRITAVERLVEERK